jgi:predicted Fe-Mo cluster-binding NifX family protein
MKVAITSESNHPKSKLDLRFGRAAWFCIFDTETQETTFVENDNKEANGGAGTRSAERMAELGVQQIISGDFGPKAKDLLDKFRIQMVILDNRNKNIDELIKQIKAKSTITT